MRSIGDAHLLEQDEGIRIPQQPRIVQGVDHSTLGEDPPVRVADSPLELDKIEVAEVDDLGITQGNEARLEMFGQGVMEHRVMNEAPRQVELAHRRPRPVDDRRRQHAVDLELLAEAKQDRVDPGGIDVGQFGQIADAHHHGRLRIPAPNLKITLERGREAKANGLDDWVNAKRHTLAIEEFDRVVESLQRARAIRDRDHLDAPFRRVRRLPALTLNTSSAPRRQQPRPPTD